MSNSYISNAFKKAVSLFQKNLFLRNMKGLMYYVDAVLLKFIKKPNPIENQKKQVLIIYNLAFGDGVVFRSSAFNLRKIYKEDKYEITLLCQKGIDKLYNKDNIYNKIIALDFNKSTVNIKERIKNFKVLRQKYYDIVLDPVGISEMTTNVLYMHAACGKQKIGLVDKTLTNYYNENKIKKIYNKIIEIKEKELSLLEYYNYFIKNISDKKINIKNELVKLNIEDTKLELPKKYFIIFPCASVDLKKWPMERYAKIAEKIYKKTNYDLVLVGTETDKKSIDEFKLLINIPYIDYVCKTSLNDYISIIQKAQLVVTNDTSAYHIAVIEETPVAIITGAYTYDRYVIYDFEGKENYRRPYPIVLNKECRNCFNRCPFLKSDNKIWPCLDEISEEYAWKIIEKLIDENYGGSNGNRKDKRNKK